MTSKEIVKLTLEQFKLPVLQETDNAIVIRYQLNHIQITSLQEDPHGIAVTLSGIFSAEEERETRLALKACNGINHRMMQVKSYLDQENDLIIAAEFFYRNDEDVEFLLVLALQSVVAAKKNFIQLYEEAANEEKLIQELNEE